MTVKDKYSASTNAFYVADLMPEYIRSGSLPDDAIDVHAEMFVEFTSEPPVGKIRAANEKGFPEWTDA
ncbi:MAG: hypothetical protein E6995_18000 [Enterobacteriaceae bacterium]|nr:hypothetical protein [Enterobacteriaceae bacterium]MDU1246108.1 hypothetical protein [Enterobacteriaceae bacterium]